MFGRYIHLSVRFDFRFVPATSTTVEIYACRDVWAVLERPGVQSLFADREKAIEHARQLLGGQPGLVQIRDEDAILLATLDFREQSNDVVFVCA